VVSLHIGDGDGVDGGGFGAPAVRVAGPVETAHGFPHGGAAGVVVAAAYHLQGFVALELHLGGFERRAGEDLRVNVQDRVEVLFQGGHVRAGLFVADGGVHRGAQELQLLVDLVGFVFKRAAVLEQAGGQFAEAYFFRGIVELAGADEGRHMDHGQGVVFHQVHHQAVVEHRAVALGRLEVHGFEGRQVRR